MPKNAPTLSSALIAFAPPVLWASIIFFLSSQQVLPSLSLNTWDFLFKKSAHIISYGILYFLLFRAFEKTTSLTGKKRWALPLFFALAYAIFDEFHQTLTPGRTGTLRDVGYDTLGCCLVLMRKFGYI